MTPAIVSYLEPRYSMLSNLGVWKKFCGRSRQRERKPKPSSKYWHNKSAQILSNVPVKMRIAQEDG